MNFFLTLAPQLAISRLIKTHFKDFKIFGQSGFGLDRKQRCILKDFSLYYLFKQK